MSRTYLYPTGSHERAGQQAEFYIRDDRVYPTGSHPRAGQQAEFIIRGDRLYPTGSHERAGQQAEFFGGGLRRIQSRPGSRSTGRHRLIGKPGWSGGILIHRRHGARRKPVRG